MNTRTALDNLRAALVADIATAVRAFFPTATAVHLADESGDNDDGPVMTVGVVVFPDGRNLHIDRFGGIEDGHGRPVAGPDGWTDLVDADEWDGVGEDFAQACSGPATSLADFFPSDAEDGTFIELPAAATRTADWSSSPDSLRPIPTVPLGPDPVLFATAKAEKHLARALNALTGTGYNACLDAVRATRDDEAARRIAEAAKDTVLHGIVTLDHTTATAITTVLCTAEDGRYAHDVFAAFKAATWAEGTVMSREDAAEKWEQHFEHLADDNGELPADVAFTDEVWAQVRTNWFWSRGLTGEVVMDAMWMAVDEAVQDVIRDNGLLDRTG
ncbi:hypothetical protein DVS28_b0187 (plasmid) [Euzebya pacifica]|uniref:Uncharacterized protein n=1 Tax=Euzebya pacifica TaxID=1608957 RepID=A0A346Y660_9ACTN|nr:hypothetical protein [Euzebya pacifica]AXV09957.1 hypothetical protein DVS28_b0187 [Euzebya pacifica]